MSLDHTAGLTRATIENVNGFTDRYGTKWNAGDWVYASRTQTEVLMNSIWGGTYEGWANESVDGSKWFLENFGELNFDTWNGNTRTDGTSGDYGGDFHSQFFFGNDAECNINQNHTCIGLVRYLGEYSQFDARNVHTGQIESSNPGGTPMAYVSDSQCYYTSQTTINHTSSKILASNVIGSLLIRATHVPEPSTLAIFALGMIGLASRRFKKQS